MSKPLAGKKALVTGGGRGIGRGIAEALAAAGADVVINYLSASNEANETCDNCKKFGVKAFAFKADASELNTIEKLVDDAENAIGPLDLVVSNAVYSDRQIFYEADLEGFQRTIQVSMWGPFYLVRTVANRMIARKQQGGSIVVISSPHAHKPIPGAMAYNMAKAAIDQMARTAAVELSPHRIRVNIVHPGWTDTPGERKFFSETTLREKAAELPWGRLGRSDEIGRGVVFLCDPASDYITGSTLTIDGGIQLPWQDMFRLKEKPGA